MPYPYKHNIPGLMGALRDRIPRSARNVGAFRALVKSGLRSGERARRQVINVSNGDERRRLLSDLQKWRKRMRGYEKAMSSMRLSARPPESAAPLFYVVSGAGGHVPDVLYPFSVENQFDVLAKDKQGNAQLFWGDVMDGLRDVPRHIGHVAQKTVTGVSEGFMGPMGPFVLAAATTVVGGVVVHHLAKNG